MQRFIHKVDNFGEVLSLPAFKKSENKSVIMDFRVLKCCKYNRFPCYKIDFYSWNSNADINNSFIGTVCYGKISS